jgi:NAD(P)H-hydrate repair Nnr-like enzyme with NAD(P)H-hydrate epimerase domain
VLELPIYTEDELKGKEHAVVDGVTGTSCQHRTDDPPATETDAINEAKYLAKEDGAEGLKNVRCEAPRGKSLYNRCHESITCTGQTIKFAK